MKGKLFKSTLFSISMFMVLFFFFGIRPSFANPLQQYDYLIIAHDDFYAHILPLAEEKEKTGYMTKVIRTSQIGVNPTAEEISNYIRNEYYLGFESLKYVLLVGDVNFIPTHYGIEDNVTDLYYATMDFNDYLPDLAVGRLPVNNNDETDTIVNKILNYRTESNKALAFGAPPEMQYVDWCHKSILEDAGFVVDTAIDPNATGEIIETKVNEGGALVAYYGHGSIVSAGDFHTSDVYNLNNTELPVFLSGGCYNNWFDNESIKSLGEELVLSPAGAIGFVGSTGTGGYGYAYSFADGFYSALGSGLGEMLNAGRVAAYNAAPDVGYGSWTHSFIEEINLLGDPSLEIKPIPEPSIDDILTLNLKSHGKWITYHIEVPECLPEDIVANTVEITNLNLNGTDLVGFTKIEADLDESYPVDEDGDEVPDAFMAKFDRQELITAIKGAAEAPAVGELEVTVEGDCGQTHFSGTDTIHVIKLLSTDAEGQRSRKFSAGEEAYVKCKFGTENPCCVKGTVTLIDKFTGTVLGTFKESKAVDSGTNSLRCWVKLPEGLTPGTKIKAVFKLKKFDQEGGNLIGIIKDKVVLVIE